MEILAGVAVDHSTWDDKLTTVNDYDDVQCHWPYSSSVLSSYWNCECLGGKTLYFTASTNNLLVKILGSLDEGVTFPVTVESEFSVAVGTPVLKYLSGYFNALKIQVKPAVAGAHGTLSVIGGGSSLPGITDVEIAGVLPDTAASDLSHIHANTDNLNVGDQAKASSISVTPATDITDGRYIGNVKVDSSALPTGASTHDGQDELKSLIGEVQVSPTSNTVLDRLKSAVTHLATIAGFISGGHGQVDVLESALPTGAATSAKQLPDGHNVTVIGSNAPKSGQKAVTTPGTQVALATTQVYKRLVVVADDTNTGYIYLGDLNVDSTTGIKLPAGGFFTFYFVDIANIFIDSSVALEGVSFGGEI